MNFFTGWYDRLINLLNTIIANEKNILNNQLIIINKEINMSAVLDSLTAAVANLGVSVANVTTLLQTLVAKIGPDETAAIQAQVDALNADLANLNNAIAANQPPVVG